jgi:hypothetical protein
MLTFVNLALANGTFRADFKTYSVQSSTELAVKVHFTTADTSQGQAAAVLIASVCALTVFRFLYEGIVRNSSLYYPWCRRIILVADDQNCRQVTMPRLNGLRETYSADV